MTDAVIYSLGMTLFHSLWQVTLVYILLRFLLLFLKNISSKVKYRLLGSSMLLSLIIACLTFFHYYQNEKVILADTYEMLRGINLELFSENSLQAADSIISGPEGLQRFLPYIVMLYLAGVFILAIRLVVSMIYLQRYRTQNLVVKDNNLNDCFYSLVRKLNIKKKIILRESLLAKVPIVLGYLKPLVIVPVGLLSQIPFNQVEAILAHELGHIKRNDFLINILQSVIELIFFYHPVIYLISKNMRAERENCCDDIALSHCKDPGTYIKALAGMEGILPLSSYTSVAFIKNRNHLLERMKRILKPNVMKTKLSDSIFAGIIILAGFFTIILTGAATLTNISGKYADPVENNVSQSIQFRNMYPVSSFQDTIMEYEDNRIITHRKNINGDQERIEMTFNHGKLTELIIDGKVIPENDYSKYTDLISSTRDEVARTSREVEKAEAELAALDAEKIEIEINKALNEAREINEEEIRMEIEEARAELEKIEQEDIMTEVEDALREAQKDLDSLQLDNINLDSIRMEIDIAMESIDWEKIREDIHQAMKEAEFSQDEMERVMKKARKAMDEIDWDKINIEIREGMEAARISLESIDWDVMRESIELSLDVTADVLKDLEVDINRSLDQTDIERDINSAREDIKTNKKNLRQLEENMEKALEELEKDK